MQSYVTARERYDRQSFLTEAMKGEGLNSSTFVETACTGDRSKSPRTSNFEAERQKVELCDRRTNTKSQSHELQMSRVRKKSVQMVAERLEI